MDYYNVNTEEHAEEKKEVPNVPFKELLKFNAPDWIFVLIGIIFSTANGTIFPLIAIPSSEILKVSSGWVKRTMVCENISKNFHRPAGQVYGENSTKSINSTVSVVCFKFLGLAIAAFLATFIGVSECHSYSTIHESHFNIFCKGLWHNYVHVSISN